jgi:hypothetical protein
MPSTGAARRRWPWRVRHAIAAGTIASDRPIAAPPSTWRRASRRRTRRAHPSKSGWKRAAWVDGEPFLGGIKGWTPSYDLMKPIEGETNGELGTFHPVLRASKFEVLRRRRPFRVLDPGSCSPAFAYITLRFLLDLWTLRTLELPPDGSIRGRCHAPLHCLKYSKCIFI